MRENEFSDTVSNFALAHNRRHKFMRVGGLWVRIRPTTYEEDTESSKYPRVMKFLHLGTVSRVTEILPAQANGKFLSVNESIIGYPGMIQIECAGDKLLVASEEFFQSWIRCIPEEEWKQTDDARTYHEMKHRGCIQSS